MAEQDDLPPGPCLEGITLVRTATCVEGVWQLGWTDSGALQTTGIPLRAVKPCGCNGTTYYDTLAHAIKHGWKVEDVLKLAESMKK